MRYFQNFPAVKYHTTEIINGVAQEFVRTVPNMALQFLVDFEAGSYETYIIQDRDRPDTLAAQWYGSSEYAWVVMLSNGMKDLYDWPMSEVQFYNYMNMKYESAPGANNGVTASNSQVYQYLWRETTTNQEFVVDEELYNNQMPSTRRTISIFDYETSLNDQRRAIKRLSLPTFQQFVSQFNALVK
jgi:hypothetical protein